MQKIRQKKTPDFIPIIDLTYKGSIRVWKKKETAVVVIRLIDVTHKNSDEPNKTFDDIKNAGGIHSYLQYKGLIILSTIMPDSQIRKFNPQKYAFFINSLSPDYYLTVDGWTYHQRFSESENELLRTINETKELISLCPNAKPLGLVKGCTENQIDVHSSWLMSLGIRDLVLHIGDFRRNGSLHQIKIGKNFAWILRKKARILFLYGFGSQQQLSSYSFADVYISYNHFVIAHNGKEYVGVNMIRYSGGNFEEHMLKNYLQMHKNMQSLKYQKRLDEVNIWEEETIQIEKIEPLQV